MHILFKMFLIIIFIPNLLFAYNNFFQEGINLYNIKKFDDAKFKFEQEIVLNPKSEMSYLYQSKIFQNLDKKDLEEQNLNTVILLNPKNEEAIYSLAKLKLKNSDFQKSRELNERLGDLCIKFCEKSSKLWIFLLMANF